MALEQPKFPELSDIEEIQELTDVCMLMADFDVPDEDLQTFEEYRDRLKLEYHRRKGRAYKKEVSKVKHPEPRINA